jgi:predicted nucleic acid-binding protein
VTALVIDASAMFPLLSADPRAERVAQAIEGHELHAPDFLALEVANTIWKYARFGDWGWDRAERTRATFRAYPLLLVPTLPLVEPASALAQRLRHAVYDCTYLALAVELDGAVLTADKRLAAAAAPHPDLAARIRVLATS